MRSSSIDKLVADLIQREPPLGLPVFASRLRLPMPRAGIIDRPAVTDKLTGSSSMPLMAIVASAGYGKTTSLAAWATHDPRPFAVIRMDRSFNDPSVLITHLAISLTDVVGVDARIFEQLTAPTGPRRRRATAQLAAEVAISTVPFVLVIDDFDELRDTEGLAVITTLLDQLPDGSQMAIASRGEPRIPVATLRAEGKVVEIGEADLRYVTEEVREIFTGLGVRADAGEIDDITARTEGWPMAVYLAARAAVADRGVLTSFSGEDRTVTDYLRAEFLDEQPDDVARLLLRSSVLDELSGPLCDAALERTGSASVLEDMERSNLLLIPMDRERRWYRVHRLLREMLRAELQRSDPELVPIIQSRASRWCEDEGQVERAVGYAQDAGDVERVGELMLRHGLRLYAMGRDAALHGWFGWLARKGSTDEAVAVLAGWLYLVTGALAEADLWARIAESGSPDRMLPDGSPVEAWTLALRAVMARDTEGMRETASRSLELLSPTSQVRPAATSVLGAASYLDGHVDESQRAFAEAVELGVSLGGIAAAVVSLGALALIAIDDGRWDEATEFAGRATRMIAGTPLDSYPHSALVFAIRARIEMRRGDARAASGSVDAAEQLLPYLTAGLAFPALTTRLVLARAHLELGDVDAATERLDEFARLEREGLRYDVTTEQVRHLRGVLDEARQVTGRGARLSPAELRLLPMLATHLTFREIAEQLFLSVHTVKAQVTSIYRKLGVASRTQAVEEARHSGLLDDRARGI